MASWHARASPPGKEHLDHECRMPDLVEVDLAGVCPESAYLLPVRSTRDPGRSVTTASGRCLSARVSGSPMGRCHDVDHNFDGRPDMIRVAPPHELVQQDSHIVMGEGVQDPEESPDAEHLSCRWWNLWSGSYWRCWRTCRIPVQSDVCPAWSMVVLTPNLEWATGAKALEV